MPNRWACEGVSESEGEQGGGGDLLHALDQTASKIISPGGPKDTRSDALRGRHPKDVELSLTTTDGGYFDHWALLVHRLLIVPSPSIDLLPVVVN